MIPALLAAPGVIEGVVGSVGGVLGSVAGLFSSPSSSSPAPSSAASFAPMLDQAAARAHASVLSSPSGTMTPLDWGHMSDTDLRSWMQGLNGKHVQAVDTQGRAVSGVVEGFSQANGVTGLNIGGHFIPLSHLNQVSWSPAVH